MVRQEIWAAIARLKREAGLSILVVDKSLRELSAIADRAVILNKGSNAWEGRIAELPPEIADRFLGV